MGAHMQMLKPGFRGKAHRHTGNVVYNVAGGRGYSIIGGERFDWQTHDIFCVPAWMWHEHVNLDASEEAFLFSFNDFPVNIGRASCRERVCTDVQILVAAV